jgi:non-specific protein-tyrosine kinase
VAAAVLRDQLDTTVGGAGDLEGLSGSVPLGVIPFDSDTKASPLVIADQFSGRAEAFRTLRTNLQFADVDNPPRLIVVTSALPSEGKTTTACNLALTLALSGSRVILVDGDLRKPMAGTLLGIDSGAGLTNVLAGQHALDDVVVRVQRDLLAVLPSGPTPPNPSELLGSQHMATLLQTLAGRYDVVVIDAPPLLPVTDAAVLSTLADGALLVVRNGKTRRDDAERALKALAAVNAKMLGSVLNCAPRVRRRGGYGGYGYGSAPADDVPATKTVPAAAPAVRAGAAGRSPAVPAGGSLAPQPVTEVRIDSPEAVPAAGSAPPAVPATAVPASSVPAQPAPARAQPAAPADLPWSQVMSDPPDPRGRFRRRVISRART